MRNVLLTGGAGYVGSILTELLLNNNFNVVVIDNLSFGGESLLGVWHNPNFGFVKGDITSPSAVRSVFKNYRIDAVIHLAAIVGDPACAKNSALAKKVNWEGSLNLLEASIKKGVKRFIFVSTCSNYGKIASSDSYVDETSPLAPVSLYAELKVCFENVILNELEKKDTFCPTALRSATIYGYSPRMRFDLTVNEFTKELVLGRELEVFGRRLWRPYCHVYDFAGAILLVLNSSREKIAYNVFNVGDTDENFQKETIVREIKKVVSNPRIKYVQREEDPRDYKVSFKKIKDELGFAISRRVPDGIREIKYLLDNRFFPDPDNARYRNT